MDDENKPELTSPGESAGRLGQLLVVSLASAIAVFVTNNWCFILIPAGLAALLLDSVLAGAKRRLIPRLALAAAVGVAVGTALRVGPEWAFREAFDADPPAGIRDVRIQRHYIGGPGEHALIIEFVADAAAIHALTSLHAPHPRSQRTEQWLAAGGVWSETWSHFSGPGPLGLVRSSWMRIQPLENAAVCDYGSVGESCGSLVLFHQSETGRCVALQVRP